MSLIFWSAIETDECISVYGEGESMSACVGKAVETLYELYPNHKPESADASNRASLLRAMESTLPRIYWERKTEMLDKTLIRLDRIMS